MPVEGSAVKLRNEVVLAPKLEGVAGPNVMLDGYEVETPSSEEDMGWLVPRPTTIEYSWVLVVGLVNCLTKGEPGPIPTIPQPP